MINPRREKGMTKIEGEQAVANATDGRSEKVAVGIKAQAIAVKRLKEKHQEEFDQIHGDVREEMGLERSTGRGAMDQKEKIRKRIERLQFQLNELEQS